MARISTIGWELQSITAGVEHARGGSGGQISIETTTVRSGAAAIRIVPSSANRFVGQLFSSGLVGTKVWGKIAFYVVAAPTVATCDIIAGFGSGAGAQKGRIRLNADLTLSLVDQGGNVIGSSSAVSLNTWYEAELFMEHAATTMTAKLDGTQFATSTGATMATYDAFYFGSPQTAATFDVIWDDFSINDSSGSEQNTWVGTEKVIRLKPNAAGDNNMWLDTTLGAGTTNNYQLVDEVIPDDATTMIRSRTTDDIDDYNMEASGISSADTVNVVHVGFRGNRSTGTTSSSVTPRLKATSGGTVTEGTTEVANSTAWRTNDLDAANIIPFSITSYYLPGTSTPWDQTTLDTAQGGARVVSGSGDRYVQVTGVWLTVGYTEATASPSLSPSSSASSSQSPSSSSSLSQSPSASLSPSSSSSSSVSPSASLSPSASSSASVSPSASLSPSSSSSLSQSPSASLSPSASSSRSQSPSASLSPSSSASASTSPSASLSPSSSSSLSLSPSASLSPSSSASASTSPSASLSPSSSASASASPSASLSPSSSASDSGVAGQPIKYWNGSAWIQLKAKYWDGSAWQQHLIKWWDGANWNDFDNS